MTIIASLISDPSKLPETLIVILQQSFDFALSIIRLTVGG